MLARLLGIEPGEGRVTGLLLAHGFLLGLGAALYETAASGLFLSRFSAESLPLVYLAAAAVVPTTGVVYGRLQRRLSSGALWTSALAFILVMQLALIALVTLTPAAWPTFVMMALSYVITAVAALEFWGLAGRVLDLRQAKRLYGLIGSGEIAAGITGGLGVALLLRVMSIEMVLLVAAACFAGCLAILALLLRLPAPAAEEPEGDAASGGLRALFRVVLADRYLLTFALFYLFYNLSHDTIDYLNLVQIQSHFGGRTEELTSFLGVVFSLRQVAVLVARSLLTGRFLARFGLGAGLAATPSVALAGIGVLVVAALASWPSGAWLFWPAVLLRIGERITWASFGKPAVLTALRPLSPARRDRSQLFIETAVEPLSTGTAGAVLMGVAALVAALPPSARTLAFAGVALVTGCGWFVMARRLRRGYTQVVVDALTRGSLRGMVRLLDDKDVEALGTWLRRSAAADAAYILDVLEATLDPARLEPMLRELLDHPAPDVRADVFARIERHRMVALLAGVKARLATEQAPRARAALARALAALGQDESLAHIEPLLAEADPGVRASALIALLKYAGIPGVLRAGERLLALLGSPAPTERRLAAEVLGQVAVPGFFHPLRTLLADPDPEVRGAALDAAGALGHPALWDQVIAALAVPGLWPRASRALQGGGRAVAPLLGVALARDDLDRRTRARAARVLARLGDDGIVALRRALGGQAWLRREALAALRAAGWRAGGAEAGEVDALLRAEVAGAAAVTAALVDVDGPPGAAVLRRALEQDLAHARDAAFALLSFLYHGDSVRAARVHLRSGSPERKTYALEVLDNLCARRHTSLVVPLFESRAPAALHARLSPLHAEPLLGRAARLRELAAGRAPFATRWTRVFALHAIGLDGEGSAIAEVDAARADADPHVREAAELAARRLASGAAAPEDDVSAVARVILLKSVELFATVDDELLADIGTDLVASRFAPGEPVFERGAVEPWMFVVARGALRVHDRGRTLASAGPGEVLGELAALAERPRSASAEAVSDALVLRIDRATLDELAAEHIDVAHGIIRLLIRRYARRTEGPVQ